MAIEPKKELGQNFLIDSEAIADLVASSGIHPGDTVIEIGPGLGAVTQIILEKLHNSGKVYAVETDPRMVEYLNEHFSHHGNLEIIYYNVLDWLPKFKTKNSYKIIASLPFYITKPLLLEILKLEPLADNCSLLLQKEVAEKITAQAPDSNFMSVFLQTFYNIEFVRIVKSSSFEPEPPVNGGIVKMTLRNNLPEFLHKPEQRKKYSGFLRKGFASPRKMLNKQFKNEDLQKAGINPSMRPQEVSLHEWQKMFKTLVLQ